MRKGNESDRANVNGEITAPCNLEELFIRGRLSTVIQELDNANGMALSYYGEDLEGAQRALEFARIAFDDLNNKIQTRINREHFATERGGRIYK